MENPAHISFEPLMRSMYFEYGGRKRVNLYNKQVIENYLTAFSVEGILEVRFRANPLSSVRCSTSCFPTSSTRENASNHATIVAALRSAIDILPPGGRILIRNGIMIELEDQQRIIRFRSAKGMAYLK